MKIGLFYNNITVLDYAYLDHHKGVVGDSLKVNIELIGKTDEEGVIFDFSIAKKKIKEIIDLECDHRLLVPKSSYKIVEERVYLEFNYGQNNNHLVYKCPREGVCELDSFHVDKGTIQSFLENTIMKQMPETVSAIKVSFDEEENTDNNHQFFHYSHGLRDHYGNCQRLFHGHRSTLEVFISGKRSFELESWLTQEVFSSNIHFLYTENIKNLEEIKSNLKGKKLEGRHFDIPDFEIEFTANQGIYAAKIPANMAYITTQETTVENLSQLFLKLVQEKTGLKTGIQINAYEGIAKGATSSI